VSCHVSTVVFRATQTDQDKAQAAENGAPLSRPATLDWFVCVAPAGQGEKQPPAVLRSLRLID